MATVEHAPLVSDLIDDEADVHAEDDLSTRVPMFANWSRRPVILPLVGLGLFVLVAVIHSSRASGSIANLRDELVALSSNGTAGKENSFSDPPCLCVFDIDRTLTGKQGWVDKCSKNKEMQGMEDQAYAKGTLLLSELGQGMKDTFCGRCHTGIVTAGMASGDNSDERRELLAAIGGTKHTYNDWWQNIFFKKDATITSSLVLQAVDGSKQNSVRGMVQWWKSKHGIAFQDDNVWFFDDIAGNVAAFKGTGFNAIQVSCVAPRGPAEPVTPGSWDGKIGGCGGVLEEVKPDKGIHVC